MILKREEALGIQRDGEWGPMESGAKRQGLLRRPKGEGASRLDDLRQRAGMCA